MPGAANDFAGALIGDLAWLIGCDVAGYDAIAQPAALVRAAIEQANVITVEVEDDDLAVFHRDDFAFAGLDFIRGGDNVTGHQV